jgi:hypothetical protein
MFFSDEEVESRLQSETNLARRKDDPSQTKPRRTLTNYSERVTERDQEPITPEDSTTIAPLHNGGRRPGDRNLDASVRAVIGSIARMDTIANTASAFGVSPHHVHELKHGKHSNAQGVDEELAAGISEKLKTANDIAVTQMTNVLLGLDVAKIRKPRDAVYVADKLASIAQKTSPIKTTAIDVDGTGNTKLIVYAPTIKQENHYESVHAITPTRPDR